MINNSNISYFLNQTLIDNINNIPIATLHSTPSSQIKNLINITSLNIQGNDKLAKLISLTYTLNPRSIICYNETKQNNLSLFSKRINNTLIIFSKPDTLSKNNISMLIGSDIIPIFFK